VSTISPADRERLLAAAAAARVNAHAPYSKFKVGAAVLERDGRIFGGCNVENASYGLTVCAERNAAFKAVSEGGGDLIAMALVTETDEPVTPCGACRQVLAEFNPAMTVVMGTEKGKVRSCSLSELLPDPFIKQ
jgi:cytidine deaminase